MDTTLISHARISVPADCFELVSAYGAARKLMGHSDTSMLLKHYQ